MQNDHRNDKWVTSFRFNEIKNCFFNRFFFFVGWPRLQSRVLHQSLDFPGSDVSLGSQCGCNLSKLCMHVVDYAGLLCNNSQTTPGITMHELSRNRPAVRRKWIKFIQFKRADFLAAPHHAHLCSEHFSECDFANHMGFALKLTRCFGTLSKSCLTGSNWYGCILVGLSGKVSVSSSELDWPFCSDAPE